jgi:hypothetical protein
MTSSADRFDKPQAIVERARLQRLLDDYEAGRLAHHGATQRTGSALGTGLDRAGKVRARIARLDEIIGGATKG